MEKREIGEGRRKGEEEERREVKKGAEEERDRGFQYIVRIPPPPWQFLIAKVRYWWLDALYRVLCTGRVYFFPPSPSTLLPGLPYATIDAVYPRDLYIFYAARTYLFFVDTRRHCCELNATRYRASVRVPSQHEIQISILSPSSDVSIFRNFFFSFFLFSLLFCFVFFFSPFLFTRRNENCRSSLRTFETRLERRENEM